MNHVKNLSNLVKLGLVADKNGWVFSDSSHDNTWPDRIVEEKRRKETKFEKIVDE